MQVQVITVQVSWETDTDAGKSEQCPDNQPGDATSQQSAFASLPDNVKEVFHTADRNHTSIALFL